MSAADIQARIRAGLARAAVRTGGAVLKATITRMSGANETTYPPTPGTATEYTATVLVSQYSAHERNGTNISDRDLKILMSVPLVDSAGNTTEPVIGDTLALPDGREYRVENVPAIQPGGAVLMWQIQARAGE